MGNSRVIIGKYCSKYWGKSPVLHCTFETTDGQETFGCFKPNGTTKAGVYSPKDGTINLNDESLIGAVFELEIKQTKQGRDYLYRATKIDSEGS